MSLKLLAEIGIDGTGFQAGLNRAMTAANVFKAKMASAFAAGSIGFAAGGLVARRIISYADSLQDMSDRLQMSTTELQKLEYAAIQSGAKVEDLRTVIEKMNEARMEALKDPTGGKAGLFASLGIGGNVLGSARSSELFAAVMAGVRGMSAEVGTSLLRGIGGRSGGRLFAMAQQDLKAAGDEAERLGFVMQDDVVRNLALVNDQFSILSKILMNGMAPALVQVGLAAQTVLGVVRAYGAYFGAMSVSFQTYDPTADESKFDKFMNAGVLGKLAHFSKTVGHGSVEGDKAFVETMTAELERLEKLKKLFKEMAVPGSDFGPSLVSNAPTEKADRRFLGQPDSLTSVGNFLGSSQVSIVQIGEKTNALLTMTNLHLAEIKRKLVATGETTTYPQ
jgi:hypothetical protein